MIICMIKEKFLIYIFDLISGSLAIYLSKNSFSLCDPAFLYINILYKY